MPSSSYPQDSSQLSMSSFSGIIAKSYSPNNEAIVRKMTSAFPSSSSSSPVTFSAKALRLSVGWIGQVGQPSHPSIVWNEQRDVGIMLVGDPSVGSGTSSEFKITNVFYHGSNMKDLLTGLLEQYRLNGTQFIGCLKGWFCGFVLDLRLSQALLFNDRYGLGRIYIHESPGGVVFATEAKALLKCNSELRQFDLVSLGEYLSCGCVLDNRTLFRGINLLPPGSVWAFSPGKPVRKERYFDPQSWEKQSPLEEEEYFARLTETFRRILPPYFEDSRRVAISITGGVDSRMIMSWAGKAPGELPCYTFGGIFRESRDVQIARQMAAICGQPFTVISVDDNFLKEFPTLAAETVYLTDGNLDVSGAVELFINQQARQIAPVRLTGSYGGEILRGLVAFKPRKIHPKLYSPEVMKFTNTEESYRQHLQGNRRSFIAFKQLPWHHFGRFILEQSQLVVRTPFLDHELVALAFRAPFEIEPNKESAFKLIAAGNPALADLQTDREVTGANRRLSKLVRNKFQAFTFKAEYAYDYGMPQWLAKVDRWLTPLHLERLFLGHHRFYHFRFWYQHQLANYVKDILLDHRTLSRPAINRKCAESLVNGHLAGTSNATVEIHQLLTLELIYRQLLE